MRIAILADPLDNQQAGVHYYTRMMIESLLEFAGENDYLLVRQKASAEYPGAETMVVPRSQLPGAATLRLFFEIPQKIRKWHPDAVIEPAHFGPWNLPADIVRATVLHDLSAIRFPQYHRFHSSLLQRLFLKKILKNTDLIIGNSNFTISDLAAWAPVTASKSVAIYPGRDPFFRPEKNLVPLKKFHINRPYFLYTGTLEPRKGLLTLLEAYAQYRSESGDNAQLVLTGAMGWKTGSIRKAVDRHPFKEDLLLTGYVSREELRALYSQCLAFVYPSEFEGFGLPIVEAMSCSAPVITARNSSLTEAGGEAALYFETGNASDLKEKMHLLSKDESTRTSVSHQSMDHAKKFSRKSFARQLTEQLKRTFKEKKDFNPG